MNENIWNKVYDYLNGTCNSVNAAIDKFDLDVSVEDVEEKMLEMNLERCPDCDWWVESSELVNDDGDIVGCEQCRLKS